MSMSVERVGEGRSLVGECPVWSAEQGAWFWVDIPANTIWRLDGAGRLRSWTCNEMVACIAPAGDGSLFLPAGAKGPALLITANFEVIRAYNTSDAYALGVGFLADRIAGGGALRASWPVNDPILTLAERAEVQKRLMALGFYQGETDGKVGPKSREAVRRFQLSRGLAGDGYMAPALLQALRAAP